VEKIYSLYEVIGYTKGAKLIGLLVSYPTLIYKRPIPFRL